MSLSREAVFQDTGAEQPEVCNETRMEDFATVGVAADKRAAGEELRVTMQKRACPANTYAPHSILFRNYNVQLTMVVVKVR